MQITKNLQRFKLFTKYFKIIFKLKHKAKNRVVITDVTKRFVKQVEQLKNTGAIPTFKALAEEIGLNEGTFSSVRSLNLNIPYEARLAFEEIYGNVILEMKDMELSTDLYERLMRMESIAEVFESIIAKWMLKFDKDNDADIDLVAFTDKVSSLRSMVSRVSKRKLAELRKQP